MDNDQLKDKILTLFPNTEIALGKQYLEVTVAPNRVKTFAKKLKEEQDLCFDYLFCLSGMDWKDGLGVVYHLGSSKYPHCLVIKTKTPNRENPVIETVSDIWKTAEFHEREVYDFFGIVFKNHPDLRRIFLDENWQGYPLRKDYVDDINIVEK